MEPNLKIGGIVLCGGQSTRMGRSKAWLAFGKETMLQRVVRILSETLSPIIVVAAPDQEIPALPSEVAIIHDEKRGNGPLQGLAGGLLELRGKAEAAYLSSCDAPFINPAFVRRMIDLLGERAICVPKIGDFHHPLAAVYRVEVEEAVSKLLAENRLRPFFLFEMVPTRFVSASELVDVDPELRALRNLNSPEDYEAALREFAELKESFNLDRK